MSRIGSLCFFGSVSTFLNNAYDFGDFLVFVQDLRVEEFHASVLLTSKQPIARPVEPHAVDALFMHF